MKKHRLYMIRKQGDLFRCISIWLHRDTVTGEWSVSLPGFGHMLMICAAKPIPELYGSGSLCDRFPRQFPHAILHNIRLGKYARGAVDCDIELMNRIAFFEHRYFNVHIWFNIV